MKVSTSFPNKQPFLTIDFYLQCFFFGLVLIFGILSFVSLFFMQLGVLILLPVTLYNSIGLTYHIFQGSYSKKVASFRKTHAISGIICLIAFIVVFPVLDYAAPENLLTFLLFWGTSPLFLVAYSFITWQDWKAMKKLNN